MIKMVESSQRMQAWVQVPKHTEKKTHFDSSIFLYLMQRTNKSIYHAYLNAKILMQIFT